MPLSFRAIGLILEVDVDSSYLVSPPFSFCAAASSWPLVGSRAKARTDPTKEEEHGIHKCRDHKARLRAVARANATSDSESLPKLSPATEGECLRSATSSSASAVLLPGVVTAFAIGVVRFPVKNPSARLRKLRGAVGNGLLSTDSLLAMLDLVGGASGALGMRGDPSFGITRESVSLLRRRSSLLPCLISMAPAGSATSTLDECSCGPGTGRRAVSYDQPARAAIATRWARSRSTNSMAARSAVERSRLFLPWRLPLPPKDPDPFAWMLAPDGPLGFRTEDRTNGSSGDRPIATCKLRTKFANLADLLPCADCRSCDMVSTAEIAAGREKYCETFASYAWCFDRVRVGG